MTGDEYRQAIEHLGMTLVGSARFFGVVDSTVTRWVSSRNPVPPPVAMLLWVMIEFNLTPHAVLAIEERKARVA